MSAAAVVRLKVQVRLLHEEQVELMDALTLEALHGRLPDALGNRIADFLRGNGRKVDVTPADAEAFIAVLNALPVYHSPTQHYIRAVNEIRSVLRNALSFHNPHWGGAK